MMRECPGRRRGLVESRPDAHTADLALALRNLAVLLTRMGRRSEAHAVREEATQTSRPAAKRSRDTPHEARLLTQYGKRNDWKSLYV